MKQDSPNFLSRVSIAFGSFFAIISDRQFAADVQALRDGNRSAASVTPAPAVAKPAPIPLRETAPEAALQLLGLLQREARFIDFIQEDVFLWDSMPRRFASPATWSANHPSPAVLPIAAGA